MAPLEKGKGKRNSQESEDGLVGGARGDSESSNTSESNRSNNDGVNDDDDDDEVRDSNPDVDKILKNQFKAKGRS